MNGPAEVQILRTGHKSFTDDWTKSVARLRCVPCGLKEPVGDPFQVRLAVARHNKEFHPHVTVLNPDHTPLGKYEVID